jgi:hypothetical protein
METSSTVLHAQEKRPNERQSPFSLKAAVAAESPTGQFLRGLVGAATTAELPANTMLAAASRDGVGATFSSDSGVGVFTDSLVRGITGAADTNRDGTVTGDELASFLSNDVFVRSDRRQSPLLEIGAAPTSNRLAFSGREPLKPISFRAGVKQHRVIAIGIGRYADETLPQLEGGERASSTRMEPRG